MAEKKSHSAGSTKGLQPSAAELVAQVTALTEQLAALTARLEKLEAVGSAMTAAVSAPPVETAAPAIAIAQPAMDLAAAIEPVAAPVKVVDEFSEELLLVLSAAVAAYLGKRPHIRAIRLQGSGAWAQQGRVFVQASHQLNVPHEA